MKFSREFQVANPSPYARSDYVEVNLDSLEIPIRLDDENLKLVRKGGRQCEIPYQIDYVFGRSAGKRIMTFFAADVPPGREDYSQAGADFRLEEAPPDFPPGSDITRIEHHYPNSDEMVSPRNEQGEVVGVKMFNDSMDVYFRLAPLARDPVNYCGSATSIRHHRSERTLGTGDVLAPFLGDSFRARWGQLTHLDFYGLPWEPRWYQTVPLAKEDNARQYTLVWSNSGLHRVVAVLKSEPFHVDYDFAPLRNERRKIKCHLYRILSMYRRPEGIPSFYNEFYSEQLSVRPEGLCDAPKDDFDVSFAFRAHFRSHLDIPDAVSTYYGRLEEIPDYFAIWKSLNRLQNFGYGVASDSHIRALRSVGQDVTWRLQLGHNHHCVHYFLMEAYPNASFDNLHTIGHSGWYERCFKPLRVIFPERPSRIDCYLAPRDEAD